MRLPPLPFLRVFLFMAYIYKITSPSKKIYVGSTININERFRSYKRLHCKSQIRLYNSLLKYGANKHKFEIIVECDESEMLSLECYYGNIYNTLSENGLNCVLPKKDDKFICRTKETRIKLSKALTGKKLSEETKNKLRLANLGKVNPNKGKSVHSIESKLKMKISHTGKKLSDNHKRNISEKLKGKIPKNYKIIELLRSKILLDINYGIFHDSIKSAAKFYNISPSCISLMLNGKRKNKFNLVIV